MWNFLQTYTFFLQLSFMEHVEGSVDLVGLESFYNFLIYWLKDCYSS